MTTAAQPERLAAAVAATRAAVLAARDDDDDNDDDDDDDEVAGPARPRTITAIAAEPAMLAAIAAHGPLTPVYAEFLRGHSSHDFVATGLRFGGRAAWITPVTSVLELTAVYADTPGFAPHWLVCAVAADGCYVLDLDERTAGDCPVLYLQHVPGGVAAPERVAPSFVGFLERVALDSRRPPVPGDMPQKPGARPPSAWDTAPVRDAPRPEAPASEGGMGTSLFVALLIAALLWLVY